MTFIFSEGVLFPQLADSVDGLANRLAIRLVCGSNYLFHEHLFNVNLKGTPRARACAANRSGTFTVTRTGYFQSSICNPGTRANSLMLLVTKVAPKLSAWAPINVSKEPIAVPAFSRTVRTLP